MQYIELRLFFNRFKFKKGTKKNLTSNRTGRIKRNITGYDSFIPNKLPPEPPLQIDDEMQLLLSEADRKLGRLDGITQVLPNPELFVAMYVNKEAVLSAQIEGTQASLADLLIDNPVQSNLDYSPDGISEVVNYVNAMKWGLQNLDRLPLSLRLIREIHSKLLENVRGYNKHPGEFRTSQNWIGPAGCNLSTAVFVPPEPDEMTPALYELENFIHSQSNIPALIKIAMIHAQFETIHPFLDGNGRMGRLLITFWLCEQRILSQPLLYLSYYFKLYRSEYYEKLMDVRLKGDWESWIKFFLKGVAFIADEAIYTAKEILKLRDRCLAQISNENTNFNKLLDKLFENPVITKKAAAELLGVATGTAGAIVETFCKKGILLDTTPNKQRYKKYIFNEYFELLRHGTDIEK